MSTFNMQYQSDFKIRKFICNKILRYRYRSWLILLTFCIVVGATLLIGTVHPKAEPTADLTENQIYKWLAHRSEYQRLVHSLNTPTILPSMPICNEDPLLLVIVCSSLTDFIQRRTIRDSWAKDATENVKVLFLVGKGDTGAREGIIKESERHSDIIQYDFVDSYINLTIKSVLLLKWVRWYCENAHYIMKVDDDMFLHIPNLVRYLNELKEPEIMIGSLLSKSKPFRNSNQKWFVPDEEYSEPFYPDYLAGAAYLLGKSALLRLYEKTLNVPFVRLEDLYVTGLCSRESGLKPQNHEKFIGYTRRNNFCFFRTMFSVHTSSPSDMYEIWNQVFSPSYVCYWWSKWL